MKIMVYLPASHNLSFEVRPLKTPNNFSVQFYSSTYELIKNIKKFHILKWSRNIIHNNHVNFISSYDNVDTPNRQTHHTNGHGNYSNHHTTNSHQNSNHHNNHHQNHNHFDNGYQYGRFDASALHIAHALKQTELQKQYSKGREKPIEYYLVSVTHVKIIEI